MLLGNIEPVLYLPGRGAQVVQNAFGTTGFAGQADISAMKNQQVAEHRPALFGYDLHKVLLDFVRIMLDSQPKSAGKSPHMSIHYNAWNTKGITQNYIGSLATHTG